MIYVIVQWHDGMIGYRECTEWGEIVRYTDDQGVTLDRMDTPAEVIDGNPPRLPWML